MQVPLGRKQERQRKGIENQPPLTNFTPYEAAAVRRIRTGNGYNSNQFWPRRQ